MKYYYEFVERTNGEKVIIPAESDVTALKRASEWSIDLELKEIHDKSWYHETVKDVSWENYEAVENAHFGDIIVPKSDVVYRVYYGHSYSVVISHIKVYPGDGGIPSNPEEDSYYYVGNGNCYYTGNYLCRAHTNTIDVWNGVIDGPYTNSWLNNWPENDE